MQHTTRERPYYGGGRKRGGRNQETLARDEAIRRFFADNPGEYLSREDFILKFFDGREMTEQAFRSHLKILKARGLIETPFLILGGPNCRPKPEDAAS